MLRRTGRGHFPKGAATVAALVEAGADIDLVVTWERADVAVADAKYKARELRGWPYADLYQLLAYCVAMRLPKGLLIFASPQVLKRHRVYGLGVQLEVLGVDLEQAPEALLGDSRSAVRQFAANALEHAKALRAMTVERAS